MLLVLKSYKQATEPTVIQFNIEGIMKDLKRAFYREVIIIFSLTNYMLQKNGKLKLITARVVRSLKRYISGLRCSQFITILTNTLKLQKLLLPLYNLTKAR